VVKRGWLVNLWILSDKIGFIAFFMVFPKPLSLDVRGQGEVDETLRGEYLPLLLISSR
jgi:hypothetical protein